MKFLIILTLWNTIISGATLAAVWGLKVYIRNCIDEYFV